MPKSTDTPQPPKTGPMGNGGPVKMTVEKPKNFKKSLGQLLSVLKPHWGSILISIALTIIATVFSILSPKFLGNMTDSIVNDFMAMREYSALQEQSPPDSSLDTTDMIQKPVFHYENLAKIALLLIILYIISSVANYLSMWFFVNVIQKMVYTLRERLSHKINRMPMGYFDAHQYGDVLSRITNDVDTLAQSLNQISGQAVSSVITVIGFLVMMLIISWKLTLIAVVVVPLSLACVTFITKRSQKYFKNQQTYLGYLNGHVEENYAGQTIVKAFSGEKKAEKVFDDVNTHLYESSRKSQFLSGLMMPLMHFISNLGYVATAVLGGWLAFQGRLSIGSIQAFIQYMGQFNQPLVQLGQIANLLQSTVAAAERVFDFLEEKEEKADLPNPVQLGKIKGEVTFDKVHFAYEEGKPIIKHFSAHIQPGQQVAIVGPTGAGKTTIVNLLMRFYDPQSGTISIDGVDTQQMKRADVRACFGMVLQDTWLFNGTIAENLKYGKSDATDSQIKAVAKSAYVDHVIESLPKGYQTEIGEESENISIGEKQLLTIARAMLADAPMLILDEATSSVDTRTEILIQKAMEKLMKGRTSFVIAHRLSTIKNADVILVMKEGDIVEQGNHEELLTKGGFYAQLYNSQFVEG
ncbi:ABC transporter [candidate division SR1 bacterium]|nr:ABC transporter [candidate division SR1 bacterium]